MKHVITFGIIFDVLLELVGYYKVGLVRLSNTPRLTKYQRVWVLWFPVQDIVYVKKDILSKTNE